MPFHTAHAVPASIKRGVSPVALVEPARAKVRCPTRSTMHAMRGGEMPAMRAAPWRSEVPGFDVDHVPFLLLESLQASCTGIFLVGKSFHVGLLQTCVSCTSPT